MQDQPYKPTPEQPPVQFRPPPGLGSIFGPSGQAPNPHQRRYRPGKSDGVLIAWSGLCFVWGLLASIGEPDAGTIWAFMFAIWVGPAFLLTIIYLVARAGRRRCPVCGNHLRHETACPSCGHDFAAAARG